MAKSALFNTESLEVKFAQLHTPDEYAGSTNHQVVVWLTDDLKAKLDQMAQAAGLPHINGQNQDVETGRFYMKFKSTVFTRDGKIEFGRVFDNEGNQVEGLFPMGGDTVALRVSGPAPARNRPDACSFYLNACQVIAKADRPSGGGGSNPFGAVEGNTAGFEAPAAAPAPAADAPDTSGADDLPF